MPIFASVFSVSIQDPTIDVEAFIELLYRGIDGLDCEDVAFGSHDDNPQSFQLTATTEEEPSSPIDVEFIQDLIGRGSDDIGYFFQYTIMLLRSNTFVGPDDTPTASTATDESHETAIAPLDDVEQRILSVAVDMYHEANEDEFDEDEIELFETVLSTIHHKIDQASERQCFPDFTTVEQGLLSAALDVYVKQSEEEEIGRLTATIASLRQRIAQSFIDGETTLKPETELWQNHQTTDDATETEPSVDQTADETQETERKSFENRRQHRRGRGGPPGRLQRHEGHPGRRSQGRRRAPTGPPAVDDCVPVNDITAKSESASATELKTYRQPGGSVHFIINGYDIIATVKHEGETVKTTIPSDAVVDGFVELFETGSVRFETQEYKVVFRVENMDGRGAVSVLFFGKQAPIVIRRTMTAEEAFNVYGFGMTAIHNDIAE